MRERWRIRRAEPRDAVAIARVHTVSWRDAYREILSKEEIESRTLQLRSEQWAETLRGDEIVVSLLEVDGKPSGFSSCGPSRDDDALEVVGEVGEVGAIYLVKDAWGQGFGTRLLKVANDCLEGRGFSEATLWVLRDNGAARAFYEKHGWSFDGGEKDCFGGLDAPALRYRKALVARVNEMNERS
jgi:GNAT superfamily N-acetyltransferase